MTALVTGATGFLGGAFVARLLAHGTSRVRCLVRPGSRTAVLERLAVGHDRLLLVRGSLASPDVALAALDDADVVYHLAAGTGGAAADLFLNTVVASKNLLEAVLHRQHPARVVLVSSFGVYGTAGLARGALVDEDTPFETNPERRDLYSQAKLRQEKLFREYHQRHGLPLVVLRPGVIYGPGGSPISSRVGLSVPGLFLHLGGRNLLPLTYVDNCAEAIVVAGERGVAHAQAYNVVDDDLPTCVDYLRQYQREVRTLRAVSLPYPASQALSWLCERYHEHSQGQLPAFFTRYRTATTWGGNRFSNAKLKSLGWQPIVPTDEGLRRTFADLRSLAHATSGAS
jgi:nucleoside-diphosphate-sugar epimerase